MPPCKCEIYVTIIKSIHGFAVSVPVSNLHVCCFATKISSSKTLFVRGEGGERKLKCVKSVEKSLYKLEDKQFFFKTMATGSSASSTEAPEELGVLTLDVFKLWSSTALKSFLSVRNKSVVGSIDVLTAR